MNLFQWLKGNMSQENHLFCTWCFPQLVSFYKRSFKTPIHLSHCLDFTDLSRNLTSDDFQLTGWQWRFGQSIFLLFGGHSCDTTVFEGFCAPDHYSQVLCELGVSLGSLQLVPLLLLYPNTTTEVYLQRGEAWTWLWAPHPKIQFDRDKNVNSDQIKSDTIRSVLLLNTDTFKHTWESLICSTLNFQLLPPTEKLEHKTFIFFEMWCYFSQTLH